MTNKFGQILKMSWNFWKTILDKYIRCAKDGKCSVYHPDGKYRSKFSSATIWKLPTRAALCSRPLLFRSHCFLAGALSRNVRLCWSVGVWALGPGSASAGTPARVWIGCSALFYIALHCIVVQWLFVVSAALKWVSEEEPLPFALARHGRPFLCEALMATRWRPNWEGG